MSYDPDRGFVALAGLNRDRYGFLKDPFSSRLRLRVGWAVGRSQPIVDYRHHFRTLIGGGDLQLGARYSGFEVVRFHGLGNQTEQSEPTSYYEVHQKQLVLATALSFGDGEGRELSIGPVFRRTSSDTTNPALLVADSRSYGSGTFLQAGAQASFDLDERDIRSAPTRGYHLTGGASYYPPALDVESSFGEVHGEAAAYLSPGSRNPTLALRVGGKRLWGTFPYSDAAFLGGSDDVRGLLEQRFAGDASVYGSVELRIFLTRFFLLFPIDLGVFGLTDVGRVFMDGQPSGRWHTSRGGGIWLAPVTRSATVQLSFAESEGRKAFYVGMGFAY
jgi:outer membrane protein assembly factor BamA